MSNNYYKVGGSLAYRHQSYVERAADRDLYDRLKNSEPCHIFNSRQMGKSSLRVRTTHKLRQDGVICASIDLGRLGRSATPEVWFADVISELRRSFELDTIAQTDRSWRQEHDSLSPALRLGRFIEDELLVQFDDRQIVIFFDEIDSIIRTSFKDDFFSFIHSCNNRGVDRSDYDRLTFCLLGVVTPANLIEDKGNIPFVSHAIDLTGFDLEQSMTPLTAGMLQTVDNPAAVLANILDWTGGQPFLTQLLCQLTVDNLNSRVPDIDEIVKRYIIDNWEFQDRHKHLRTNRDRLLSQKHLLEGSLNLYRRILDGEEVPVDNKPEQIELRLAGLVSNKNGRLQVYNRIYERIFNRTWLEKTLTEFRPYADKLEAWLNSNRQEQFLLRAQDLRQAEAWRVGKNISALDFDFLTASQAAENCQIQDELTKKHQELAQAQLEINNQFRWRKAILFAVLGRASQQVSRIKIWLVILSIIIAGLTIKGILSDRQRSLEKIQNLNALADTLRKEALFPEALETSLESLKEQNNIVIWAISNEAETNKILHKTDDILRKTTEAAENTLVGHESEIHAVNFSADSKMMATASEDRTVRLWNFEEDSYKNILENSLLQGHEGQVWDVKFPYHNNDNNQIFATASWDGTVKIWHQDGRVWKDFKTLIDGHREGNDIFSISFNPKNDNQLVAVGKNKKIALWDLNTVKNKSWATKHTKTIVEVSFSPDGKIIATASDDATAELWTSDGKFLAELKADQIQVNGVSFSPDGTLVATSGDDSTVKVWDLKGIQPLTPSKTPWDIKSIEPLTIGTKSKKNNRQVISVRFDPRPRVLVPRGDTDLIATASFDGTVKVWELFRENGKLKYNPKAKYDLPIERKNYVWAASFSPDGKWLASGSRNSTARLWHLEDNRYLLTKVKKEDIKKRACNFLRYLKVEDRAQQDLHKKTYDRLCGSS